MRRKETHSEQEEGQPFRDRSSTYKLITISQRQSGELFDPVGMATAPKHRVVNLPPLTLNWRTENIPAYTTRSANDSVRSTLNRVPLRAPIASLVSTLNERTSEGEREGTDFPSRHSLILSRRRGRSFRSVSLEGRCRRRPRSKWIRYDLNWNNCASKPVCRESASPRRPESKSRCLLFPINDGRSTLIVSACWITARKTNKTIAS